MEKVENIGGHYVKALRLWREKFMLNFEEKIKPALLASYPSMSGESVEVFRRKWKVRVFETVFTAAKMQALTYLLTSIISLTAKLGSVRRL